LFVPDWVFIPSGLVLAAFRKTTGFTEMKPDSVTKNTAMLEPCLVVEDDSIILLDLEHTLRQFGFIDLRTATTLSKAQMLAADPGIRFAILDYALGKSNSLDIAEKLTARCTPVVFLTAYGEDVELPPVLSNVPVLSKPFTTAQLAKVLNVAISAATQMVRNHSDSDCDCCHTD
jgi:DNA-binding response OmpR family regulator